MEAGLFSLHQQHYYTFNQIEIMFFDLKYKHAYNNGEFDPFLSTSQVKHYD